MQLAQAMNLNLSDGERVLVGKRYTNNAEAYDRYLRDATCSIAAGPKIAASSSVLRAGDPVRSAICAVP
jgi:hypothetical protein